MPLGHRSSLAALPAFVVAATVLVGCAPPSSPNHVKPTESPRTADVTASFDALEARFDARLGVYALDTGTGESVEYRADERFAFASTYKALAAAALLEQKTPREMSETVLINRADLVTYSPITETAVSGGLTLNELAAAAIQHSDNTAGNLLFDALGGPAGFDAALAAIGDDVTVSQRKETELNDYLPGSNSDTSTPRALATDLWAYALGDALDSDSRQRFTAWLRGNTTGDNLIRAGVPTGWVVGDKTGAAGYGTRNDIAVVWPLGGEPIVIAILSDKDDSDATYDDALIAEAASAVVDALSK